MLFCTWPAPLKIKADLKYEPIKLTVTRGNFIGYFSLSTASNWPSHVSASGHFHQGPLSSPLRRRRLTPPLRKKTTWIISGHQDPSAIQAVTYIWSHDDIALEQVDSIYKRGVSLIQLNFSHFAWTVRNLHVFEIFKLSMQSESRAN